MKTYNGTLFKNVGILFTSIPEHYILLEKILENPNFIRYIRNNGGW